MAGGVWILVFIWVGYEGVFKLFFGVLFFYKVRVYLRKFGDLIFYFVREYVFFEVEKC